MPASRLHHNHAPIDCYDRDCCYGTMKDEGDRRRKNRNRNGSHNVTQPQSQLDGNAIGNSNQEEYDSRNQQHRHQHQQFDHEDDINDNKNHHQHGRPEIVVDDSRVVPNDKNFHEASRGATLARSESQVQPTTLARGGSQAQPKLFNTTTIHPETQTSHSHQHHDQHKPEQICKPRQQKAHRKHQHTPKRRLHYFPSISTSSSSSVLTYSSSSSSSSSSSYFPTAFLDETNHERKNEKDSNTSAIPMPKLNNIPYVHAGYAAVAPLFVKNEWWMCLLKKLMPFHHQEVCKLISNDEDPVKLMKWAEHNPIVTAFGVLQGQCVHRRGERKGRSRQQKQREQKPEEQQELYDDTGIPVEANCSRQAPTKSSERKSRLQKPNMTAIEWDIFLDPQIVSDVDGAIQKLIRIKNQNNIQNQRQQEQQKKQQEKKKQEHHRKQLLPPLSPPTNNPRRLSDHQYRNMIRVRNDHYLLDRRHQYHYEKNTIASRRCYRLPSPVVLDDTSTTGFSQLESERKGEAQRKQRYNYNLSDDNNSKQQLQEEDLVKAAEFELNQQIERLVSRMVLAHGTTGQLITEALGIGQKYNFSRIVSQSTSGPSTSSSLSQRQPAQSVEVSFKSSNNGKEVAVPATAITSTKTASDPKSSGGRGIFVEQWVRLFLKAIRIAYQHSKKPKNERQSEIRASQGKEGRHQQHQVMKQLQPPSSVKSTRAIPVTPSTSEDSDERRQQRQNDMVTATASGSSSESSTLWDGEGFISMFCNGGLFMCNNNTVDQNNLAVTSDMNNARSASDATLNLSRKYDIPTSASAQNSNNYVDNSDYHSSISADLKAINELLGVMSGGEREQENPTEAAGFLYEDNESDIDRFSIVMDLKSRYVPSRVWAKLIDYLQYNVGLNIVGIGSFDIEELRNITKHCTTSIIPIIFFHSAGDLQRACHSDEIQRGDTVVFNGGSLLWQRSTFTVTNFVDCCGPITDSTFCSNYSENHLESGNNDLQQSSYTIYPFAYPKYDETYTKFPKQSLQLQQQQLSIMSTIQDYQMYYNLNVGVYVQEFSICPEALSAIINFTNDHPKILKFGMAYGGLNGITLDGIHGDGLWNQRYISRNWDMYTGPTDKLEMILPEDNIIVREAITAVGDISTLNNTDENLNDKMHMNINVNGAAANVKEFSTNARTILLKHRKQLSTRHNGKAVKCAAASCVG